MTKKRIFILTLALSFLVSTTGLPITYHLCKMMETKSLSECDVCINESEEIVFSCCSRGTFENKVTIASENTVCCQDEFVYNKVDDEFVNSKTDANHYISFENLYLASQVGRALQRLKAHKYFEYAVDRKAT